MTEQSPIDIPAGATVHHDGLRFRPADHACVAYRGSLTTPSCSEGVTWRVLVQPITVSPDQLARRRAIDDGNARPVQPLGERDLGAR